MKKHSNGRQQGFTLVELLVVIVIIGLLAGILIPGLQGAFRSAEKNRAQTQIKDLEGAFRAYFSEYNGFSPGWGDKDGAYGENNAKVVNPLLNRDTDAGKGKNTGVNYKGIVFVELDAASLKTYDEKGVYLDPWGKPYEILLDLNFDDEISSGTGSSQSSDIKAKVGVQSPGPDGEYGTKDDLRTW